jgi:hypothetical protein
MLLHKKINIIICIEVKKKLRCFRFQAWLDDLFKDEDVFSILYKTRDERRMYRERERAVTSAGNLNLKRGVWNSE